MDQNTLVIAEAEKEAGRDLIQRLGESRPVQLAFWLKPTESPRWFLYILADGINDSNVDRGYREVLLRLQEMPTAYLDPFQVKLIPADSSLRVP